MSVIPTPPRGFEVQAPVVIVGGGACGLTAALAAGEQGVAALVLERDPVCSGSSGMSLGALCAAGTADQRRHGVEDGPEPFLDDILKKSRGRADRRIAETVAAHSGAVVDWLAERHDLVFAFDPGWTPGFGHSRARMHATAGRSGADMMGRLLAACSRAEIDVLNDAHVTDLYADPDGRISGVRMARPDGSCEDIGCGALILASCGYGGSRELVSRYIPSMKDARYFGWEGNQGDAVRWGAELGADLGDMDAYQGLGLLADPQGIDVNPRFLLEGGIQINARGDRFSNEVEDVSGQGAVVIAQPGSIAWVVYDERIHRICADLPQYRALLELNARRSAGTEEELAAALGVPAPALHAALLEAWTSAETGRPDRFGRRFSRPSLSGPYHALRVTGALFHTLGGLRVDEAARVLRVDGGPFPNLFAGGGAARGFSGPGPSGYLPGAGLCAAVTLGRLAGEAAARAAG